MNDKLPTTHDQPAQPMTCPECGGVAGRIIVRHHFEIPPVPGVEGAIGGRILVRYPVIRCTVCQTKFITDEGNATIGSAIREFSERQLQPLRDRDKAKIEVAVRCTRRANYLNGAVFGVLFVVMLHAFASRDVVAGIAHALNTAIWIAFSIWNISPIDSLCRRRADRTMKKIDEQYASGSAKARKDS